MKRELESWLVVGGMALIGIVWAPHDIYCNKKRKKKAANNQKIYKEMYRGKYGY